ncbi:hypothetical protein [Aureimonas leprariae]|uniref:Uncharacterized protein n=1 Tax=Plantimonas leprariae TaxID=2615207 RepID=A0A7V7PMV4_9HYPH|nr:hypothetical protein [Aureimonas leprariae]KAB0678780.1 hypothetical protein F6X38_14935 [Aureimonas leprariae]
MRSALAALAFLAVPAFTGGPAAAFDRFGDEGPGIFSVQERGWGDDWRERRDWRGGWDHRGGWGRRGDMLSEGQVARRLMRQGFVRIDDVDLRRDRYIVTAIRPNGALIRLAVNAYDGDVVARERIGWVAGGRGGYDRDYRRPATGIEFDLGGGTLGVYSR